jgi:hypothetical protein
MVRPYSWYITYIRTTIYSVLIECGIPEEPKFTSNLVEVNPP